MVGQVVVPGGDARVDDRDADAGAVVAPQLLGGRAPTGTAVRLLCARDRAVMVDGQNFRALGNRLDDAVREFDRHAVDELELPAQPSAELVDLARRWPPAPARA